MLTPNTFSQTSNEINTLNYDGYFTPKQTQKIFNDLLARIEELEKQVSALHHRH